MKEREDDARVFDLLALNKATRLLTSIHDLRGLCEMAVDIMGEMGSCQTCALYLEVDTTPHAYRLAAQKSVVGATFPPELDAASAPWTQVRGVERRPFAATCPGVAGDVLVVPLHFQGWSLGFFVLHERVKQEPLTRDDAETLETLAAQVATSLKSARLYEELRAKLEQLEQAHALLKQAEARYRALVEQIPAITYSAMVEVTGGALQFRSELYVSPQIAAWGYAPAEWLADPWLWAKRLHPDDRERVLARYAHACATESKFSTEYRLLDRRGREVWVRHEAQPVAGEAGRPLYMQGVMLDVTEQKQAVAQLERLRAESAQREKLATMSELLAGVAHELNNPLAVVIGRATILRQHTAGTPLAKGAETLSMAAERCARIVKNFLALSRQHPPERSAVCLVQVLDEAIELLAYPLRVDDVQVERDFAPDVPVISADRHQLTQVVINLVTNAHHALRALASPRRLVLSTRLDPVSRRVVLRVADNGPGIPPEIASRIFEPFFTTKPAGQGTGLGLSICQGIVESHGGSIRVESVPGQGATFIVELPAESPRPTAAAAREATSEASASGAILVVDDEPEILALLVDLLAQDGHRVDTAPNGIAALEKLGRHSYDAVLTDIRMPALDGPGLWRQVERTDPDLARRFVFITGDMLNPETRAFLEASGLPRVSKPLDFGEVQAALRRVLRGDGA